MTFYIVTYLFIGATENTRPDIARPNNAAPDKTVVLEQG